MSLSTKVLLGVGLTLAALGAGAWVDARRARRRADQEIDRFFSLSLDLLCIADFSGRFVRLNPAWEKTLGYSLAELQATPFLDFVHPEDRADTQAQMARLLTGGDTVGFENRYRCRDGSYRWMLWMATPFPERRAIYATARDITDRKRDEMALREVNAELEAFSYSVSHDLRAPLRAVDGFARLLHEDFGTQLNAEGRRLIDVIRANAQFMGRLIDDLLQFSRLGRKTMTRSRVDLTDLARQVVAEVRNAYPDRTIDLTVDTLPPAQGDAAMLRQVLYNLVDNAFKFTGNQAAPRVTIGHDVRDGDTVYYVRDNGTGFDMRYVNKVFGVFQRLHRAEEFPGTGVGLALAQRIVLRHGGRIWAEAAVGEGATFSFILPRAE